MGDTYRCNSRSVKRRVNICSSVNWTCPRQGPRTPLPEFSIVPILPEPILGTAKGRSFRSQKSYFLDLVGIGSRFAAVQSKSYHKAIAAKRGRELRTDWLTEDVVPQFCNGAQRRVAGHEDHEPPLRPA